MIETPTGLPNSLAGQQRERCATLLASVGCSASPFDDLSISAVQPLSADRTNSSKVAGSSHFSGMVWRSS